MPAPEILLPLLTDQVAMKRYVLLSIAALILAAGLSAAPANAQPGCDLGHAFVLMLGVGY